MAPSERYWAPSFDLSLLTYAFRVEIRNAGIEYEGWIEDGWIGREWVRLGDKELVDDLAR
jgi:hypothetical protein